MIQDSLQNLPVVWSIAASDSSGGAGIQADIKTFFDLGVHGCSALTAITAQNTQGVAAVHVVDAVCLQQQLLALKEDLPPAAIKIGVLPSVESAVVVVEFLQQLSDVFVVYDTVLSPTLGQAFANQETVEAIKALLPYVDLVTPNIPEAQRLTGIEISNTQEQQQAAQALVAMGATSVLVKGGHGDTDICQDLFYSSQDTFWMTQAKVATDHSHGTGCTLSSAIAAFVASGKSSRDAVVLANAYVHKGLCFSRAIAEDKRGCVVQTGWPDDLADFPQVSFAPAAINYPAMPVCDTHKLGLYPVVDSVEWLEKLFKAGVKTIQLRVKDIPPNELDDMVAQASTLGRQYQARLFINDYWELAIKHNAYGVHLGQEDMAEADIAAIRNAGLRLGISTHGEYEFSYAATFKPSYLAIGAIFPTDTKEVIEVGLDNLHDWATILDEYYPLVAIGGINLDNIEDVLVSGVGSVAVVSAITKADDYGLAVEQLNNMINP